MSLSSFGGNSFARRLLAALCVASLVALMSGTAFVAPASAQKTAARRPAAPARDGEEQRVVHVLNRLGFGARPGDVERVRRLGVERYVEQQLNPSSIHDEAAEARLKNFETLGLSNAELLAKYPNPGMLLRQAQRRGELTPELAELVGRQGANQGAPRSRGGGTAMAGEVAGETAGGMAGEMETGGSRQAETGAPAGAPRDDGDARREYRRAVGEYMRERGLRLPRVVVQELQASRVVRAVYSERQLQEVMVDFWTNHFNVFAQKGADRWLLTSYDRDVIRPNALGDFRRLLEATAKSPAMLFYLDNFQSVAPNSRAGGGRRGPSRRGMMRRARGGGQAGEQTGKQGGEQTGKQAGEQTGEQAGEQRRPPRRMQRGVNENYARELLELHTLGVEGGYTQRDVQEVARAFTGWTIRDPRGNLGGDEAATFRFNPRAHDDGEKVVLGQKIPAGGGMEDGLRVLDILTRHPSTAKFIATKLARRFVSDDPPPALVARVAAAFAGSGGDIKATLRALFNSPEFFSAEARRAKIKTPFEYAASAVRALGAEVGGGPRAAAALHQWVARMGEPLYMYQAPTGYPDTAEHWVNTGALLERMNFALALAGNRIPGVRVDLARLAGTGPQAGGGGERERVVERLVALLLNGELSPRSREALARQLSEQPAANAARPPEGETAEAATRTRRRQRREEARPAADSEVVRIAALVVGSPEFQRQ
ncbi:MAG TPA: DUF1800 domain-containing protein [Pyrinomonadaceae bacterium]|nr:DUF1800 domain-containing protein [Pyrinomonadaceae bacterium]